MANSSASVCVSMFEGGGVSLYQSQLGHCTVRTGVQSVWVSAPSSWSHHKCLWATSPWLSPLGYRTKSWMGANPGAQWRCKCSASNKQWCFDYWKLLCSWPRFMGKRGRCGPVTGNQNFEILTKDAACPLPWMPYTAGEPLPSGAVTGGHLADRSVLYVAKIVDNNYMFFGYYNPKEGWHIMNTTALVRQRQRNFLFYFEVSLWHSGWVLYFHINMIQCISLFVISDKCYMQACKYSKRQTVANVANTSVTIGILVIGANLLLQPTRC